MRLPSKEQIEQKLMDYSLLRLLFYERWFRVGFAAFLLVFVFLALFLPKIWTASKPGFLPVIKVSGLDLVQAWSLKRTAVRSAAEGKFDEALYAWQSALANNRADEDLVRGALTCILQDPNRRQRANQAMQECYWLLKLTGTNITDLGLVAQVLEQYRAYDAILELVEPRRTQLTGPLAASYLKALFNKGRMAAFNARWEELHAKAKGDPELPLYRAAYLAGWGPPGTITAARQQVEAATNDPAFRVLAYRLKLVLSAHAMDPAGYSQALSRLEEWREDTLAAHAQYWRLLAATGHKAEALRRIEAHPNKPTSPLEAIEIAKTYSELGEPDKAVEIMERYSADFGRSPVYLITWASELLELQRWEDLRNLALKIRTEEGAADHLGSFAHFVEGRAELGLGREANADAAFRKVAEREFLHPSLAQKVAFQLYQLGRAQEAKQVLVRLEDRLGDELSYWLLMFSVADRLQDADLLLRSATKAYELNPSESAVINNYAAALIITRKNPQEVIRLTLQLLAQNPNSVHAIVNHSAALNLNHRPKEAEALLTRVPTNALTRSQLAIYYLDLFESQMGLAEYEEAWSILERIEPERLYPPQREWLDAARRQLPPRQKAG